MANFPTSAVWEAGIYQWADGDPLDGDDGLDSLPIKQLAHRTDWLKSRLDSIPEAAGLTPDNSDPGQFLEAVRRIVAGARVVYRTPGTHAGVVPAGRTMARVYVWGAGSGAVQNTGGSPLHGEGGGGGAYTEALVTGLTPDQAFEVVIGSGGACLIGTTGSADAGGDSSITFDGLDPIHANGASGAALLPGGGSPGLGGAAGTSGDINLAGQTGRNGNTYALTGDGGAAPFGGTGGLSGGAAGWPGGGGSISADGTLSAPGADGGVIVHWF